LCQIGSKIGNRSQHAKYQNTGYDPGDEAFVDAISRFLTSSLENEESAGKSCNKKRNDGHDVLFRRLIRDQEDFVLTDHTQHISGADIQQV